eukprot:Skav212220  [mRNA]  locus=scaffold862:95688:96579:- [translate_table: standard]
MLTIGLLAINEELPNILLLSPLHRWYGGGNLEQTDLLGSLSMANIKMFHPWLYHLHGLAVIWVVLAVRQVVFKAQSSFMARRMAWTRHLPYPRANTVLVEGIPKDYRTEEKVSKFFNDILGPDSVACAHLVKKTATLEDAIELQDLAKTKLEEAKACLDREGVRPTLKRFQRFPLFNRFGADNADAIDHFSEEAAKQELQIKEIRAVINRDDGTGSFGSHSEEC